MTRRTRRRFTGGPTDKWELRNCRLSGRTVPPTPAPSSYWLDSPARRPVQRRTRRRWPRTPNHRTTDRSGGNPRRIVPPINPKSAHDDQVATSATFRRSGELLQRISEQTQIAAVDAADVQTQTAVAGIELAQTQNAVGP